MAQAESIAVSRSYGEWCLWLLQGNADSLRICESQGWALDGTVRFVDFLNANIVRMRKALALSL